MLVRGFFARRLQAAPLGLHERGFAILALELAVGEQALGTDDFAVLEIRRGLLEAVGAHGAQALVSDELPTCLVVVVRAGPAPEERHALR